MSFQNTFHVDCSVLRKVMRKTFNLMQMHFLPVVSPHLEGWNYLHELHRGANVTWM